MLPRSVLMAAGGKQGGQRELAQERMAAATLYPSRVIGWIDAEAIRLLHRRRSA